LFKHIDLDVILLPEVALIQEITLLLELPIYSHPFSLFSGYPPPDFIKLPVHNKQPVAVLTTECITLL